jgi:thiamine pyrophosphate-dependent acetolactate synthase large subunit-like protein
MGRVNAGAEPTAELERRTVVSELLAGREGLAVITGLGSPTYDVAAVEDHDRNFYLWGAMGGAVATGLGLALARPDLDVLVVTGDGEMLMGMGSLATVAPKAPEKLAILVLENGVYGETGMQPSHTSLGSDLCAIAKGCGIRDSWRVSTQDEFEEIRGSFQQRGTVRFLLVRVSAEQPERVMPTRDAVENKLRFQKAVEVNQ